MKKKFFMFISFIFLSLARITFCSEKGESPSQEALQTAIPIRGEEAVIAQVYDLSFPEAEVPVAQLVQEVSVNENTENESVCSILTSSNEALLKLAKYSAERNTLNYIFTYEKKLEEALHKLEESQDCCLSTPNKCDPLENKRLKKRERIYLNNNLIILRDFKSFLGALLLRVRKGSSIFADYYKVYEEIHDNSSTDIFPRLSEQEFVEKMYLALNAGVFAPKGFIFLSGNIGDTRNLDHVGSFTPPSKSIGEKWELFTPRNAIHNLFFSANLSFVSSVETFCDATYKKYQELKEAKKARNADNTKENPYLKFLAELKD